MINQRQSIKEHDQGEVQLSILIKVHHQITNMIQTVKK